VNIKRGATAIGKERVASAAMRIEQPIPRATPLEERMKKHPRFADPSACPFYAVGPELITTITIREDTP